jgi:hypothetical protein
MPSSFDVEVPLSAAPDGPVVDGKASLPSLGERVGRGIGSTTGYAARSFVGVAADPVVKTVWTDRPNMTAWQKVAGTIAWPLMLLTPHGWVFLGASFFMMVILGDKTPYSWAVWVTRWATRFLVVTLVLVVIVVVVASAASSNSNTGTILPPQVITLVTG